MFTVKWHNDEIGYEEIISASAIWERNDGNGHFVFVQHGDDTRKYDRGAVYVMNENGKTVADYHLSSNSQNPSS